MIREIEPCARLLRYQSKRAEIRSTLLPLFHRAEIRSTLPFFYTRLRFVRRLLHHHRFYLLSHSCTQSSFLHIYKHDTRPPSPLLLQQRLRTHLILRCTASTSSLYIHTYIHTYLRIIHLSQRPAPFLYTSINCPV